MSTIVTQTVTFDTGVERAYRTLADSAEHSAFTGAPAKLPTESGEQFTTHGGAIEGRTLELVPNERIVQAWRVADWPQGVYSIVRYEFSGDNKRTEIKLTHTGLPEDAAEHIAVGWQNMYWTPLTEYFSKKLSSQ
ncbi:MAG: SRPBCC domain-containing protein [Ilumatobacteraceae bacterium]